MNQCVHNTILEWFFDLGFFSVPALLPLASAGKKLLAKATITGFIFTIGMNCHAISPEKVLPFYVLYLYFGAVRREAIKIGRSQREKISGSCFLISTSTVSGLISCMHRLFAQVYICPFRPSLGS